MRDGENQAAHEPAAPTAYIFDGWSMVPLDSPRREAVAAEPAEAQADALPA